MNVARERFCILKQSKDLPDLLWLLKFQVKRNFTRQYALANVYTAGLRQQCVAKLFQLRGNGDYLFIKLQLNHKEFPYNHLDII